MKEQLELDLGVTLPKGDPLKMEEVSIKEPNPQDVCRDQAVSEEYAEAVAEMDAAGATYVPQFDPFTTILNELELLHNRKRADYGSNSDPYANVRASAEFGIPPWIGVMVRLNDKVKRIKAAATGSTLQNESIIDSFNDLAVYAIIARILYEEQVT